MSQDETQVMMSTLEASDDQKKNKNEIYGDFRDTVKVDGRTVQCLYDTVATKASVSQKMKVLRYVWPTDFKFLLDILNHAKL